MRRLCCLLMVGIAVSMQVQAGRAQDQSDKLTGSDLIAAARKGDLEGVQKAIAAGVDVNSKTEYDSTALFYACDRGNLQIVDALLKAGADPNIKDNFYGATPLTWAQSKNHFDIIARLLEGGVDGADDMLLTAVSGSNLKLAQAIVQANVVKTDTLSRAFHYAKQKKNQKLIDLFEGLQFPEFVPYEPTAEQLQKFIGKYRSEQANGVVQLDGETLKLGLASNTANMSMEPVAENEFRVGPRKIVFQVDGDEVKSLVISFGGNSLELNRQDESAADPPEGQAAESRPVKATAETERGEKLLPSSKESLAADAELASSNWPGFRGNGSRGVFEGQGGPKVWDAKEDKNMRWRTEIPGLGNSCPTIWGDHLYVTSAVSDQDSGKLRIGLYGNVDSVEDDSTYQFKLYCLDKTSGELLWENTCNIAKPAVKRHAKSSHANPTVAADENYVVAFFGSEGLYCYDHDGQLVWQKDLGILDSGWFYDPGYQWGFGASPVIYQGRVFVQCDIQENSFLMALDVTNGDEVWRVDRDEIPGWSSPTVHRFGDMPMVLTHGTRAARGYDARTGEQLWELPKHSEIVVPTPFVAHDLIFVASGYRPIQPIYAIKPTARGDISLTGDASTNEHIPWSVQRGGPYMPSPVAYGDYLYSCSNNGILTCYHAKTGAVAYKQRMRAPGGTLSFTASPIAGDGHLYLTAEDGRVLVVREGPEFELVSTNPIGESVLATPAASDGMLYFRTQNSVIAVGEE